MRRIILALVIACPSVAWAQDHPVFFNDSASTDRWAAWKASYDANPTSPATLGGQIYKRIKTDADSGARYMDKGQLAAWMYHVTGDAGYVAKAWTQLDAATEAHAGGGFLNRSTVCSNAGLSGNYSREHGWELVLMYDWLYPGMSAGERSEYLAQLKAMFACVTATGGPAGWAFRAADTDQTTGDYMMMAMAEAAIGSYDATVDGYWSDASRKIGGYAETATDFADRRNALNSYMATWAAGGEWMEGSEYNLGTLKLLLLGAAALRSAQSPTDNYDDITAWQQDAAEAFIHAHTPGISATASLPYQWGDVQSARSMMNHYRWETCISLAGVTGGTTIGPKIQDFCLDYLASSTLAAIDPYPRGFYVFDPDATRGDYTTLDLTHYASGEQILLSRTGWTASDSMFGAQLGPWTSVKAPGAVGASLGDQSLIDHGVSVLGEFQLWKGGAWAITHPISYGGTSNDPRGTNGLTHGGLGAGGSGLEYAPREYRKTHATKADDANGYVYAVATEGGSVVGSGFYNMPAQFVMEHTRSLVYLPALDIIAVHDRSNSKLPSDVGTTGYSAAAKAWIDSRPRRELWIHSPVSATVADGYLEWAYSGSNKTRVNHLLPTTYNRTEYTGTDLNALWNSGGLGVSERKFYTILTPASDSQWQTLLNVWDAYGVGTPATTTLVQDTSTKVDAALITKGSASYLLAFNAVQAPDIPTRTLSGGFGYYAAGTSAILDAAYIRETSFSLAYTATQATKAVLFGLDTGTEWTYQVNGSEAAPLTVSAEGIGVIDIATTGAVTLDVLAGGDLPVQIQTGSLPHGRKGTAYSQQLVSSGGAGSAEWDITVGALQTGLSLSAGGLVSGTPTVASAEAVTFRACDPSPNCGTREITVTVDDVPAITTASLDDCHLGSAYEQTLEATGGSEPYTFSVTGGDLPTGLSLAAATGVISGTCSGALGLAQLEFTVTDDAAATGTKDLGITVVPALPTLTVSVQAGSSTAVVHYGITGLPYQDECVVSLKDGESTLDTVTDSTGASRRAATFTALTALTTYGIDVTCGTATLTNRAYFTTQAAGSGVSYTYRVKVPAYVVAAAAEAVVLSRLGLAVFYRDATAGLTGNGHGETGFSYSCRDYVPQQSYPTLACSSGVCSVTLSLSSGKVYEMWHRWSDMPFGASLCGELPPFYATTDHRHAVVAIP